MIVVKSDKTVWVDVDDTLILWKPTHEQLVLGKTVKITCPAGTYVVDGEDTECKSWTELFAVHSTHVEQIKRHKIRGHTVIIWSAGGWQWANAVVKALQLEQYVDLVISKPSWIYDDLPAERFMPKNQWEEDK